MLIPKSRRGVGDHCATVVAVLTPDTVATMLQTATMTTKAVHNKVAALQDDHALPPKPQAL